MTDEPTLTAGTGVRWKSQLGYTYVGTVVRGNDTDGYDLITADGAATSCVPRDVITVQGSEPADGLTDEERAAALDERCRRGAESRATDTIMALTELLRANVGDVTPEEGDVLRVRAAGYAQDGVRRMVQVLLDQIADKQERLAKAAAVALPAVVVEPLDHPQTVDNPGDGQ